MVHYFAGFVLFLLFSGLTGLSYFAFRIFARNNFPGIYYVKNTVGINQIDQCLKMSCKNTLKGNLRF